MLIYLINKIDNKTLMHLNMEYNPFKKDDVIEITKTNDRHDRYDVKEMNSDFVVTEVKHAVTESFGTKMDKTYCFKIIVSELPKEEPLQ